MIIGVTVIVRVLREEEGRYLSEWRQNDASSVDWCALETEGKATVHQMQVFKSRGHQGTGSHPEPQKECPSANASFEPGSLVFRLLSYRKWSEECLCLEQPCSYWFPAAAAGRQPTLLPGSSHFLKHWDKLCFVSKHAFQSLSLQLLCSSLTHVRCPSTSQGTSLRLCQRPCHSQAVLVNNIHAITLNNCLIF